MFGTAQTGLEGSQPVTSVAECGDNKEAGSPPTPRGSQGPEAIRAHRSATSASSKGQARTRPSSPTQKLIVPECENPLTTCPDRSVCAHPDSGPSGSYRWWLVAKFVVGREGEAYDVRAKGPNRKFQLDWRMTQGLPGDPPYRCYAPYVVEQVKFSGSR